MLNATKFGKCSGFIGAVGKKCERFERDSLRKWSKVGDKFLKPPLFFLFGGRFPWGMNQKSHMRGIGCIAVMATTMKHASPKVIF